MRKPLVLHSLLIQEVIAGGVIIFVILEHLDVLRKAASVEALLIKVGRGLGLDDGVVHTREYIALRLAVNSKTRIIFVKSIIFISITPLEDITWLEGLLYSCICDAFIVEFRFLCPLARLWTLEVIENVFFFKLWPRIVFLGMFSVFILGPLHRVICYPLLAFDETDVPFAFTICVLVTIRSSGSRVEAWIRLLKENCTLIEGERWFLLTKGLELGSYATFRKFLLFNRRMTLTRLGVVLWCIRVSVVATVCSFCWSGWAIPLRIHSAKVLRIIAFLLL